MPVPKRRTSSSKRDRRRSHDALSVPAMAKCGKCGARIRPHRVCSACGFYGERQVRTVGGTDE
jgi:large subunit ribosomal protein L32